jgi:serine/threonine protein kinase
MKPYVSVLAGRLAAARSSSLPSGLVPFPGCSLRQFRGRGGFGEVWEADVAGGPPIALKFITCDATTAPREIRSLQQIRQAVHPHLIRIEKVFCSSGYLVVGMELAQSDVLDFLNARQHRIDGQLVAFRHCDVKPSNMLLFGETVKLADFGVTLMTTLSSQAHLRCGTPDYAAPEVFVGKVTDRTDQYALAVSYYVLRTGRPPFPDTPPDFRRDYVRPGPDLNPLAPRERPILLRALAPSSLDRWPSCTELMAQLSRAVQQSGRHRLITRPKRYLGEIATVPRGNDTSAPGSALRRQPPK